MTPALWAVMTPDGRIDHELVGTQHEVEWWCSTDEGRAAGRRPVALFTAAPEQPAVTLEPDILAQYTRDDGERQWVDIGTWLYPGAVLMYDQDPRNSGRWYALDAMGVATLCADEADARRVRDEHEAIYPGRRPHRAVRMAVVAEIDSDVAGSSPAIATTTASDTEVSHEQPNDGS
jgi:hypothetical protein